LLYRKKSLRAHFGKKGRQKRKKEREGCVEKETLVFGGGKETAAIFREVETNTKKRRTALAHRLIRANAPRFCMSNSKRKKLEFLWGRGFPGRKKEALLRGCGKIHLP